jgi:phosphatidylglycerol lysyltransferase
MLKGFAWEEAIALVLLLLALLPARREFYLSSSPLSRQNAFGWLVAIVVVLTAAFWLGLFSYKHLDDAEWWRFTLQDNASRFLRASIAAAILVLGAAAYCLLSAVRYRRTAVHR